MAYDPVSTETPVTPPAGVDDTPDAAVRDGFIFGWRMAELYNRDDLPAPRQAEIQAPVPPHLPGASEMSDNEKARVIIDQARAASRSLAATLGVELSALDTVIATLDRPDHHADEVRREILAAYLETRDRVAGVAPLAATSCGLGRMLADTALMPRTGHPEVLAERFDSYRLSNAYRWLEDLSTALPRHAAGAVKASLSVWEGWAQSLPRTTDKLDPSSLDGAVVRKLYPTGTTRPTISNINISHGTTVNNQVTVGLGTNSSGAEAVSIYNAANNVDVTVDVEGYYQTSPSGSTYVPITPARICDTRSGSGTQCTSHGTIGSGSTLTVQASNGSSVPAGATAIVADLTAISPTSTTYLTTYANGTSRPSTSNLNAASGMVVNKEVTIPIDSSTKFVIYNVAGSTNVTVDVEGYFDGSANSNFVPVSPQRICDTRANDGLPSPYNQCNGSGGSAKTIGSGGTLTIEAAGLPDVPSSATAIVAAVTTLNETTSGYLTIYPAGASRPTTSEINFTSGATDNNEVTVGVGTSGDITIYNSSGSTDVLVDLLGYYTSTPSVASTSFTYNGDGLRMSSTVSSTTSQFTYDLSSSVPAVLTDGNWYYIYGPTGPGGQQLPIEQVNVSSGTTYYLHEDINGSVVAITDSTGHTVGSFSYDPFGNLNGLTGSVTSPIGYASGYLDSSTGLYYLMNRYYDPATAQFVSIDPLVATTGQPYQYAGDDPINGSDPSGLSFLGGLADSFNPWSPDNVFRRYAEHHPLGGDVILGAASVGIAAAACYLGCPLLIAGGAAEGESNPGFFSNLAQRCQSFLSATGDAGSVGGGSPAFDPENQEISVQEYASRFLKGDTMNRIPKQWLNMTVKQALKSGDSEIRKYLTNNRWLKQS